MKDLKTIVQYDARRFLKRYNSILVLFLVVFSLVSVFYVYNEVTETNAYLKSLLSYNINSPIEERKILNILEQTNTNFRLKVISSGSFCSTLNCYNVSFAPLYFKMLIYLSIGVIFLFSTKMLATKLLKESLEGAETQLELLKNILDQDQKNYDLNPNNIAKEIVEVLQLIKDRELLIELGEQSRSVGHDLNSPLAILEMVSEDEVVKNSEYGELLGPSIERIKGISTSLLKDKKRKDKFNLLLELNRMIDEKKFEYNHVDLEIDLKFNAEIKKQLNFDKHKFLRILSNIINNSVDARTGSICRVCIEVEELVEMTQITISDNGAGFPEQILIDGPKENLTIGKTEGNGIGLFSACKDILASGGLFNISNNVNGGACVSLSLPT